MHFGGEDRPVPLDEPPITMTVDRGSEPTLTPQQKALIEWANKKPWYKTRKFQISSVSVAAAVVVACGIGYQKPADGQKQPSGTTTAAVKQPAPAAPRTATAPNQQQGATNPTAPTQAQSSAPPQGTPIENVPAEPPSLPFVVVRSKESEDQLKETEEIKAQTEQARREADARMARINTKAARNIDGTTKNRQDLAALRAKLASLRELEDKLDEVDAYNNKTAQINSDVSKTIDSVIKKIQAPTPVTQPTPMTVSAKTPPKQSPAKKTKTDRRRTPTAAQPPVRQQEYRGQTGRKGVIIAANISDEDALFLRDHPITTKR